MAELKQTLDGIVRREKGRVVGALVRALGSIDAAEEAFQEALVAALDRWKTDIPANPAAWLTTAAKNWAHDARRHANVVERFREGATPASEATDHRTEIEGTIDTIADDELRLVFTCCHPALTLDSQVALTLKVVLGFTTDEIARAFLCPEKTIAQRISRAKAKIEEDKLPYEVPARAELPERLSAVLAVVYLVFNEGHTSREGPLMRLDLQVEALRLGRVLADLLPDEPEVYGLFALMAFAYARAKTRVDDEGGLLLLSEQDRARWDRRTIKEGLVALERARRLGDRGSHVIQSEIAACHTTAPSWEATDWPRILALYDELTTVAPSPVVALNRAVALSMIDGPRAALDALRDLEGPLASYHLFYTTRAHLRQRLGEEAGADYARAIELTDNESERAFLRRRVASAKKILGTT